MGGWGSALLARRMNPGLGRPRPERGAPTGRSPRAPPMASPLVRARPRPPAGRRAAAGGYHPAPRAARSRPPLPLVETLRTPGLAAPAARGALAAPEGRGRASAAAPARSLTVRTLSPGGPRPDPAFPRPHGGGDGRRLRPARGGAG